MAYRTDPGHLLDRALGRRRNIDRKALFLNKLPLSLVRLFNNLSCEDIDLLRESSDKLEEFAKQMNVPGSEINRYISKFPTEDLFSYKLTQIEQKIDEDSIADQILYLPAYRRIEQGLQSIFSDRPQEIEVIRARIRQGKKDLRGKELVDFGMEDVETKICQINKNDVKNVEDKAIIGNFLKVCNSYLSNKKELVYDHVRSEIFVRQSLEGIQNQPVTLNKLSSGEKQIVSLFAHLYLSEQKSYFVIIDEPELSLSVPWQRRFLTDILETKRCNGLIAVTHSPFVYDNELKQYAHSLEEFMEVSHVLS